MTNTVQKLWMTARHRLVPPVLLTVCLIVVLMLRGMGWDGDSIVNIAQFEKLIHPALSDTPDAGSAPKLLPIFLFGFFH
jgi:hypothetical protein